ncbi:MAG TPA: hypothetical protein VJH37_03740 [Candidatus Nanoarchaeia archaeon]|nr:hypothetical protein [Candidatus Nanoarchaeia archaeon]
MKTAPTKEDPLTTIGIRFSTKEELQKYRVGDESFNSVVNRLLLMLEKRGTIDV